jgi:AcrR family transcriptional regulator
METQERIITKAHELFMRYGVRSVSMDEIAAHLGMSKKTIYQFYADKDALVAGVIDIEVNNKETECGVIRGECENAIHEIFLSIDGMQEMLTSMNTSLVYELEKYHPAAFRHLTEYRDKFLYSLIRDNCLRGIAEGIYRDNINVDIITTFRLHSVFLLFNPTIFAPSKFKLVEVIEEITDNFLFGIVTPKGQKLITKYKQQRQKK